ncbi:MAG TPA: hypothetical protein VFD89_06165 [Clostridia bacterium]|nr:hypothetical protein [Clostridia bacterium]
MDILKVVYSKTVIDSKRKRISFLLKERSTNIKSGVIEIISTGDLGLLFGLYDEIFFDNWFRDSFKGKIKFSLSRRMTKSAGKTLCPKDIDRIDEKELVMEIRIGTDFFFNYGELKGNKSVCGIQTNTALEALQLVFEHEICHVLEFINFKESSCSGDRFKTLANNLFGHMESYHKLPTNRQIANQKYGFKIGDRVSFVFDGRQLSGILYNITKRATVMVEDDNGIMADDRGNRYTKYYVPLPLLK